MNRALQQVPELRVPLFDPTAEAMMHSVRALLKRATHAPDSESARAYEAMAANRLVSAIKAAA